MSSSTRTTSRGGKGTKEGDTSSSKSTQKADKSDTSKAENKNKQNSKGSGDKGHSQQSSGNGSRAGKGKTDSRLEDNVRTVCEMTKRTEDEVVFALHDCGQDLDQAVIMLIEQPNPEWVTAVKKKKNRSAVANKADGTDANAGTAGSAAAPAAADDWGDSSGSHGPGERDKGRGRGGGPPRMRGRGGWRGREARENEKNLEDGGRRGRMSNGPARGGGPGRGGRGGGRLGSRTFQSRDGRSYGSRTVDTWNQQSASQSLNESENWDNCDFPSPIDDWYNEEYTGSLADTKVFTPSMTVEGGEPPDVGAPVVTELPAVVEVSSLELTQEQVQQTTGQSVQSTASSTYMDLVQQADDLKVQSTGYSTDSQQYNNTYVPASSYMQEHSVQQPLPTQRIKTQRARVPPPSKIPASAVEMPGELNSSVGYLDVQFGALDFMSDSNSVDGMGDSKFNSGGALDGSVAVSAPSLELNVSSQPSVLETYGGSPSKPTVPPTAGMGSALSQAHHPEPTADHTTTAYGAARSTTGGAPPTASAPSLDMSKTSDVYSQPQPGPGSYQSYQPQKSAASVYQSQSYSSSSYQPSSQVSSTSSYASSPASSSYVNSNNYQNSSYSSGSSYQSGGAGATAAAFPGSGYQQGAATYASGGGGYSAAATGQYNSYGKKEPTPGVGGGGGSGAYDASQSVQSNTAVPSTAASSAAAAGGGSSNGATQPATGSSTKVTGSAAKGSVVAAAAAANIPPGVAPMMAAAGTGYIMGQAGVPYFQQPVYSYEELQLLQQRVPHMGAYYDISYQTPTTLAAARESTGAYSMSSDSRFTRSDSNASPVPSTLSQQTSTQSHQAQPMLSATLPPGYAYFYNAAGMMPGSFQYGTPAIYPQQMPAATNAHASTTLGQYPKPSNYSSAYGSGYDALGQSQDYGKTGYAAAGSQSQNKAAGAAVSTGSSSVAAAAAAADLSAVMYGKSHVALGKVNSYEKQGFHSGTPPPFNLAGSQNAGIAPSGTYAPQTMYIHTMPHQQQHNTTTLMHQPLHQMDMRPQTRRADGANSAAQRSQSSSQAKSGTKPAYPASYWNQA